MIKVTAIIGSPEEKGNSETLLKTFLKGMEQDHVEAKIYDLKQLDIAYHCHQCKTPLEPESEFKKLVADIETSQLLIIATPTYNFSVPARLKNLVDRLGFMALDYQNLNRFKQPSGKLGYLKTYFIVTGGTPNWIKTLLFPLFPDFWLQVVFWYYGAKRGGSQYAGELTFTHPAKKNPKLCARFERLGEKTFLKLKKSP